MKQKHRHVVSKHTRLNTHTVQHLIELYSCTREMQNTTDVQNANLTDCGKCRLAKMNKLFHLLICLISYKPMKANVFQNLPFFSLNLSCLSMPSCYDDKILSPCDKNI